MTDSLALRLAKQLWDHQMAVWPKGGQLTWEEAEPRQRERMLLNVRELALVMGSTPHMTHKAANSIAHVDPALAERVWAAMRDGLLDEVAQEIPKWGPLSEAA